MKWLWLVAALVVIWLARSIVKEFKDVMSPKPIPKHNPHPISVGTTHKTNEARHLQKWRSSARWQKVRKLKLDQDPLCERCKREGRMATPGQQVHHIEPAALRPDLFFVLENLETVCHPCHGKYNAEERRV